jgi:ABC-type uncharacterized transport system permease subunit
MDRRVGWLPAAVGATTGGIALALGGGSLGGLYAERAGMIELDALGPMLVGAGLGLWVGSAAGCWVALRVRNYEAPSATAAALAVVMPIWVVIGLLLAQISQALRTDLAPFVGVETWIALTLATPAALTRLVVARWVTRRTEGATC